MAWAYWILAFEQIFGQAPQRQRRGVREASCSFRLALTESTINEEVLSCIKPTRSQTKLAHRPRDIFCPAQRLVWLPLVEINSGQPWRSTPTEPPLGETCTRAPRAAGQAAATHARCRPTSTCHSRRRWRRITATPRAPRAGSRRGRTPGQPIDRGDATAVEA